MPESEAARKRNKLRETGRVGAVDPVKTYSYKAALIGGEVTGKTSFIRLMVKACPVGWVSKQLDEDRNVGIIEHLPHHTPKLKVIVTDSASVIANCHAAILLFSWEEPSTFDALNAWTGPLEGVIKFLVGTHKQPTKDSGAFRRKVDQFVKATGVHELFYVPTLDGPEVARILTRVVAAVAPVGATTREFHVASH